MDTKHADARSYIYSLGRSLYYLLTGKCLYTGDTVMKKLMAHQNAPVPSLVDEFRRVSRIIKPRQGWPSPSADGPRSLDPASQASLTVLILIATNNRAPFAARDLRRLKS